MLVIGMLLIVVGVVCGGLSVLFVKEASWHTDDPDLWCTLSTWSGFFQGLFLALVMSGLAIVGMHYAGWR